MIIGASESVPSTISPFSDVPTTHWASAAIGSAYSMGYLSGNGDGTFAPERTITLGEATTIALRMLGYTTADIGYTWPDDFVSRGKDIGLLDGITVLDDWQVMTRGDSANLLTNLLNASTKSGQSYGTTLGSSTVKNVVILDTGDGTVEVLSNGDVLTYNADYPMDDSLVFSCRGTLILGSNGDVKGYLPNDEARVTVEIADVSATAITALDGKSYPIPSSATVVLGNAQTTFGTSYYAVDGYGYATLSYGDNGNVALVLPQTGGATDGYALYGFYENASPNYSQPETISMLGTELDVDDTVAGDFSNFAIGDKIKVTLDDSGTIVGVESYTSQGTAIMAGILGKDSVALTSGIVVTGALTTSALEGQLVRVTATGTGKISAYALSSTTTKTVDVTARTLGDWQIAQDCYLYECVEDSAVKRLNWDDLPQDGCDVHYYHLDENGEVDILLLEDATGTCYTYGNVVIGSQTTNSSMGSITNKTLAIENGDGTTKAQVSGWLTQYDGKPGAVAYNGDGTIAKTKTLTATDKLSRTSVQNLETLVYDGVRYDIMENAVCYNTITDTWTDLETLLALCPTIEAYCDTQVRVIYGYLD